MDVSAIGSQYLSKPASTYKPKTNQTKNNSSAIIDQKSLEDEKLKKKEVKRIPKAAQITKKVR